MAHVAVKQIIKKFGLNKDVTAVNKVSFNAEEGKITTLLGPSGCGKSTTLKLIAGLEELDDGEISIGETLVSSCKLGYNLVPEKREVGMVFQSYALWPHMTVFENIAFPLKVRKLPKKKISEEVYRVLKLTGMEGLEKRTPSKISGGQQQRVALARALVYSPKVLLLDEPLSNLDAQLRNRVRFELKELQKTTGITMVYVTHDQSEAMTLSHKVIVMNNGIIEQEGPPNEIYYSPKTKFVADFVGSANIFAGRIKDIHPGYFLVECQELNVLLKLTRSSFRKASIGNKVLVCCRPERINISKEGVENGVNKIAGRILKGNFLGSSREYELLCGDKEIRVITNESLKIQEGETVFAYIDERDLSIVEDTLNQANDMKLAEDMAI